MSDFVISPKLIIIGVVALGLLAILGRYVRRWSLERYHPAYRRPHDSETPEGAKRHAERMEGLRALARETPLPDSSGDAEHPPDHHEQSSTETPAAAREENGHW